MIAHTGVKWPTLEETKRELGPQHCLHSLVNVRDINSAGLHLIWKRQVGERPAAHLPLEPVLERKLCSAFTSGTETVLSDEQVDGTGVGRHPILVAPFLTKLQRARISDFMPPRMRKRTISVSMSIEN